MAQRLNCGEVQPYSSLWAPHRLRRDGTVSRGAAGTCVPTYMGRNRETCRGTGCGSTCLWQRLSRSTTPSRSTMALCQPPNILTTTQDLHPGTAAFTMLRSTCCGALRQESWHTRRLLHGDVCTPYTQGSHQCVPWLGQSFQQKRLSQPDVPG